MGNGLGVGNVNRYPQTGQPGYEGLQISVGSLDDQIRPEGNDFLHGGSNVTAHFLFFQSRGRIITVAAYAHDFFSQAEGKKGLSNAGGHGDNALGRSLYFHLATYLVREGCGERVLGAEQQERNQKEKEPAN